MTAITAPTSTGTVGTSGSTTFLSGTVSGLDTTSLINAAVAQKTARADTIDAKVTANQTKISAYQTLQGLVSGVSSAIASLAAGTFSSAATTPSAFDETAAGVTASDGSTGSDYMAVSTEPGAAATSYQVSVTQLAKAMKVASAPQPPADPLGYAGTFSLGEAGGTAADITVTSDMTLQDLAKAINAATGTSGISASLIQVAGGSSRLVLSANDTNKAITATAASGDDVLAGIGLTDAGGAFVSTVQAAQPASLTIDGIAVTSDTNDLTDTVDGLSISLLGAPPAGVTLDLDVEPNYSDVKAGITGFITAYNKLRDFVVTNQTVGSDGSVPADAVLFADNMLRGVSQQLGDIIAGASGGAVSNISNLGISLDATNHLQLSDETELDNGLLSQLPDLKNFFQSSYTASDSALKLLNNDTQTSFDFNLDVTTDPSGALTGATVGGVSGLFNVDGARIIGAPGSIYEGLSFALVTTGSSSIHVSLNQGFANKVVSLAKQYGDAATGLIQGQISGLQAQDADDTQKSQDIRTAAETYRTTLVAKYAAMETEMSSAKLLQAQIAAILGNTKNDSSS
jgi:flagellar hook-associated protein 2